MPDRPALTDGAAYDPATDAWTRLAPAPVPLGGSDSTPATAVVGTRVYFLSTRQLTSPTPLGPPSLAHTFLRYDAATDRWDRLLAPAYPTRYLRLSALGDDIIAYPYSHESYGPQPWDGEQPPPPDLLYDAATATWDRLPADPHRPAYDRTFISVGNDAVLLTRALVQQPGTRPPVTQTALLQRGADGRYSWRALPNGDGLSTDGFHVAGRTLVNIGEESADGGEVNNWGRRLYEAASFDLTTGSWSPLPSRPRQKKEPSTIDATVGGGRFVALGNWLYDVAATSWTGVPSPPDSIGGPPAMGYQWRTPAWVDTATGGSLVVWGGVRWAGGNPQDGLAQLLGDGWRLDVAAT